MYQGKYKSVYNPGIEFETDYIARESARDLMYHNQGPLTEYDLNDLPSADVRPVVRGRWHGDVCGVCGVSKYNFFRVVEGSELFGTWNFCPKCGADLRGGDTDG